jgi:hypothetical protein
VPREQSSGYSLDCSRSAIPLHIHWIACTALCESFNSHAMRAHALQITAHQHTYRIAARMRTCYTECMCHIALGIRGAIPVNIHWNCACSIVPVDFHWIARMAPIQCKSTRLLVWRQSSENPLDCSCGTHPVRFHCIWYSAHMRNGSIGISLDGPRVTDPVEFHWMSTA